MNQTASDPLDAQPLTPLMVVRGLMGDPASHVHWIQRAWRENCDDFFVGLDLATNSSDFKVSKVPALDELDTEPGTLTFQTFLSAAMNLAGTQFTDQQANDIVRVLALSSETQEWNLWYRRILLKSLARHLPMETIQSELIRLTTE